MEGAAPAAGAALSRVRQLQHGQLEHDSDDMQLAARSRKALTIAALSAADGGVAALSTPTASALSTTDSDFAGSDRGTVDGDDKVAALTAACRTILEVRVRCTKSCAVGVGCSVGCGGALLLWACERSHYLFMYGLMLRSRDLPHHLMTHFPFLPAASISTTTVTPPAPSVPG
jgi:hypothetical protein